MTERRPGSLAPATALRMADLVIGGTEVTARAGEIVCSRQACRTR